MRIESQEEAKKNMCTSSLFAFTVLTFLLCRWQTVVGDPRETKSGVGYKWILKQIHFFPKDNCKKKKKNL